MMHYQSMQAIPVNSIYSSCNPIPVDFFQNYCSSFESKISHLSFSVDNRINGVINKNSKSFSKINSSINTQKSIFYQEKKNKKFKDRIYNLELLIFANKIKDLENAKKAFNTYVIKQTNVIKKLKLDMSKLEKNSQIETDEEEIKKIQNEVKNNYEHFGKAYKSVLSLIKNLESDINEQLESIRLKNKEYKELKQLKFELVQKRGEFNQFKKHISSFQDKIKYFTLIIIINVIIICCLVLFIYLKI